MSFVEQIHIVSSGGYKSNTETTRVKQFPVASSRDHENNTKITLQMINSVHGLSKQYADLNNNINKENMGSKEAITKDRTTPEVICITDDTETPAPQNASTADNNIVLHNSNRSSIISPQVRINHRISSHKSNKIRLQNSHKNSSRKINTSSSNKKSGRLMNNTPKDCCDVQAPRNLQATRNLQNPYDTSRFLNNRSPRPTPKHLVPCPFLRRRGYCLQGFKYDFLHRDSQPTNEQHLRNDHFRIPPFSYLPPPTVNQIPFPWDPNLLPPLHPPMSYPYISYPPPLMSIPTKHPEDAEPRKKTNSLNR